MSNNSTFFLCKRIFSLSAHPNEQTEKRIEKKKKILDRPSGTIVLVVDTTSY